MFTQRDRGNEGGALMIEAIALLGLMTMMSPMVVRQTAERTSEMEEVAVAGQMKELKDAVNNYISAHYNTLANQNQNSGTGSISAADLAPFLSAGALDGNAFRGNKLVDGYNIGYRYDCTEYRSGPNNIPCFGASCSVSAATPCVRHRITALIVSNGDAIDDRRASRIASMIGADGGYVRSDKLLNSLGQASDQAEKNKILGSQGMWEGSVTNYGLSNISTGGQIAATTVFSSGASGDFLYRKQVDGIPDANSMFTDLDMGGANQNCAGPNNGCHKINNAGGLEVVNGRIIIRSANNNLPPNQEGQVNNDPIALDRDNVVMNVTHNVNIGGNTINISTGVDGLSSGAAELTLNKGAYGYSNAKLTAGNILLATNSDGGESTRFQMSKGDIALNAGDGKISVSRYLGGARIHMNADSSTILNMFDSNIDMQTAQSRLHLGPNYINMNAARNISLNASNYLNMNADEIKAKANYSINMSVWDDHTYLSLNDDTANLKGGQSASVSTATAGLSMSSDDEDYAYLYAGDGDVSLDLDADASKMSGRVNGRNGTNGSTFALTPTSYNLTVGNNARLKSSISLSSGYQGLMTLKSTDYMVLSANGGDYYTNGNGRLQLWGDGEARLSSSTDNGGLYIGSSIISVWGGRVLTQSSVSQYNGTDDDINGSTSINTYGARTQIYSSGNNGRTTFAVNSRGISFNQGWNSTHHHQILFNYDRGFEVNSYALNNIKVGESTWKRAKINVAENGKVTAQSVNSGWVEVDFDQGNSDYAPYQTHAANAGGVYQSEPWVKTYRLNPAFMSVMNDIRLTSRGGARLSEALPNYILKGIYVLTNSYTKGGWPCNHDNSQCKYSMPKYTPQELGLTEGGYEYRCGSPNNASNHPHQGTCDNSHTDYVTFNYSDTDYSETCSFSGGCWAHPFLGVVPAPGRSVNYRGSGALHAQDEGVCPDGYQAVMTLTPSVFELGRVSHINYRYVDGANQIALYEPGFQDFTSVNRDQVNIMQAGTKLGVYTKAICGTGSGTGSSLCPDGGSQVHGWAIAMGTVTQDPTDASGDKYVWNVGGVPAGSWSAIAHTYCYFNPARFTMPNMSVGGDGILRSMESGWGHY